MAVAHRQRSAWEVTWSVWRAMFIRETLQRTMSDRFSWFWMLAQPMLQVLMFVGVREVIGRGSLVAGVDYIPWLVVGMMVFMMFSEGIIRSMGAISANKGLFSYRQVQILDPVIVRVAVEGYLKSVVFLLLIVGFNYSGVYLIPMNPFFALIVWLLAWCLGMFCGIFFTILTKLVPGLETMIRVSMMPLYFLSGVMIPVNYLPNSIQQVLTWNPALHLVELIRLAWFSNYHAVQGVNVNYVGLCIALFAFLALAAYIKFEDRLKAL